VTINGRVAQRGEAFWNSDLIECRRDSSALVSLFNLGEVTVSSSTTARLSIDDSSPVLVVAITAGSLNVRLSETARALVAVGDNIYATSDGADFRVTVRDERQEVRVSKGSILHETSVTGQTPLPVKVSIDRQFKARTNAAVTVRVRVTKARTRTTSGAGGASSMAFYLVEPPQVAQGDEPVTNTPVRFDLSPTILGTATPVRVITDSLGYATTIVTAGSNSGKGTLRATAEESGAYAESEFTVMSSLSFMMRDSRLLLAIGAAAAAIVVPIVIVGDNGNRKITPIGDPIIKP